LLENFLGEIGIRNHRLHGWFLCFLEQNFNHGKHEERDNAERVEGHNHRAATAFLLLLLLLLSLKSCSS
jgi:hypothetical protein